MGDFLLRLKTKEGPIVVKDLTPKHNMYDLKQKVCDLTKIDEMKVNILSGYPPKSLDLSNFARTIEAVGLRSGDTLIVEEKSSPSQQFVNKNEERLQHITAEQFNSHGILMRRTVPSDNSCLFTSIGFVLGGESCLIVFHFSFF